MLVGSVQTDTWAGWQTVLDEGTRISSRTFLQWHETSHSDRVQSYVHCRTQERTEKQVYLKHTELVRVVHVPGGVSLVLTLQGTYRSYYDQYRNLWRKPITIYGMYLGTVGLQFLTFFTGNFLTGFLEFIERQTCTHLNVQKNTYLLSSASKWKCDSDSRQNQNVTLCVQTVFTRHQVIPRQDVFAEM